MSLAAVRVPVGTVWAGPDAPRDVDAPAIADSPDVAAWCRSMGADLRQGLHGRTLTQTLFGEPVVIRSELDGWCEIAAPWQPSSQDAVGYPGWIPASHLADLPDVATDPVAVVAPTAELTAEPAGTAAGRHRGPLAVLSFGTVLPSIDHAVDVTGAGHTKVACPGGLEGWLPDRAVRPVGEPQDGRDLVRMAAQFIGLDYLWGGTSSYGLDCSGLVHAVSRVLGVRVPRDAHDQHRSLEPVDVDLADPGDLYFFARSRERVHHVGFVTDAGMLHAPETGRGLEDGPLAPERTKTLVGAARLPRP